MRQSKIDTRSGHTRQQSMTRLEKSKKEDNTCERILVRSDVVWIAAEASAKTFHTPRRAPTASPGSKRIVFVCLVVWPLGSYYYGDPKASTNTHTHKKSPSSRWLRIQKKKSNIWQRRLWGNESQQTPTEREAETYILTTYTNESCSNVAIRRGLEPRSQRNSRGREEEKKERNEEQVAPVPCTLVQVVKNDRNNKYNVPKTFVKNWRISIKIKQNCRETGAQYRRNVRI